MSIASMKGLLYQQTEIFNELIQRLFQKNHTEKLPTVVLLHQKANSLDLVSHLNSRTGFQIGFIHQNLISLLLQTSSLELYRAL